MSYRNQINQWLSYMRRDYGSYVPRDFSMQSGDSSVSDGELYSRAMDLYKFVKHSKNERGLQARQQPAEEPGKKMWYLAPHTDADGSVYYIDRFTNRVVMSMVRQSNGLFSYRGPREMMTIIGGRGELGDMLRRVEDNDFFHDRKAK